jgi:hypothetical protein
MRPFDFTGLNLKLSQETQPSFPRKRESIGGCHRYVRCNSTQCVDSRFRGNDTAGLARMFHQGRARVGCDAVRWQGATTLRARAREEEQRGQRTAARLNRVCSARTLLDLVLEAKKVSIHAVLRGIEERPGEICGLEKHH